MKKRFSEDPIMRFLRKRTLASQTKKRGQLLRAVCVDKASAQCRGSVKPLAASSTASMLITGEKDFTEPNTVANEASAASWGSRWS